jgi:hypothetical protein
VNDDSVIHAVKLLYPKLEHQLLLAKQVALIEPLKVELVSKELNHLAAILHVYAVGLNFMKNFIFCYYFSKRKWKFFYTFNHFYSESLQKEQNSTNLLL